MRRHPTHTDVSSAPRLPESRPQIDQRDPWEFCGKPIENIVEPLAAPDKTGDMREALPVNRGPARCC
jgi:hypothetical protein